MTISTPGDRDAGEPDRDGDASAREVGPEDEKREALRDEPSGAQAVKDEARRRFRSEAKPAEGDATLMGLDAPGFGERSAEDLRRAAASEGAEATAREDATVDAEFGGMDNDLVDMGDFGADGTGSGTETGGAGERLRPAGVGETRPAKQD